MDKIPKNLSRKGAADPVKDKTDIALIYRRLVKLNRHREAELFLIGCNVALRISDLLSLEFEQITFETRSDQIVGFSDIREKKTKKKKRVTFNPVAVEAIARLRELNPDHVYLFQAMGNRVGYRIKPVSPSWVFETFKEVKEDLDLGFNFSSHSMRKTFGYHAYKGGADINVLQKLFNHSNVSETFLYIGITEERVSDTYMDFSITLTV